MKFFISIICIGLLLTGCEEPVPQKVQYTTVLIDQTEKDGYQPNAKELLTQIIPNRASDGVHVTLRSISDITFNPKQTFVLSKATLGWMANEDKRRKTLKKFYKRFEDSLVTFHRETKGFQRSEIFKSVVEELNELTKVEGTKKVLLFSDLQEHSFFSVYHKHHLYLLEKHPEKVQQLFEEAIPITMNNLKDIELHILYQPTLKDAKLFSQLVTLYKNILEPKGVIITVGFHHKIQL